MGLIYDDVLDITWLQDAGLGGLRNWNDAVALADGLVFGGFDDWRLPSMSVAAGEPTGSAASVVDCSTATEVVCLTAAGVYQPSLRSPWLAACDGH